MTTTAATESKAHHPFGPHWRTFELVLLIFNIGLFVFCIADWRGWLPGPRGSQALRMVYFSGALVLQTSGSLIRPRPRSMPVYLVILAASMALLVLSVTAGR